MKRQNKKRNTGLVYEFLIRHISKCLIESNKEEAQKTLDISKKYFYEGSPLKNELNLFTSVFNSKKISKESLVKIVEHACKYSALMNGRLIDEEKSKLIKEINHNLSEGVYDYKVPNYINYSSLQILLNEARVNNKRYTEIERIKIKDILVSKLHESLLNSKKIVTELKKDPKIDNTVYRVLVKKFNEKYADKISENQKKFLLSYTANTISEGRDVGFDTSMKEQDLRIQNAFVSSRQEFKNDKTLLEGITKCESQYNKLKSNNASKPITDDFVADFMTFIKFADEAETKDEK